MPKSPRKKKDDGKLKVLQKGTEMVGAMAPQFQLESTNAKVTNLNATEYSYLEPSLEELEERTRIQISAGAEESDGEYESIEANPTTSNTTQQNEENPWDKKTEQRQNSCQGFTKHLTKHSQLQQRGDH